MALFDVIETLDRPKLARGAGRRRQKQGRSPRLFVQVNTGEEPQKAGVAPAEADAFIRAARETYGLPVEGLMCIPPGRRGAGHALRAAGQDRRAATAWPQLRMGMSDDFETAVRFGATHVRVGSALFGARPSTDE